ncbi:conserved hypothetical protein, partial [Ricinus communis]
RFNVKHGLVLGWSVVDRRGRRRRRVECGQDVFFGIGRRVGRRFIRHIDGNRRLAARHDHQRGRRALEHVGQRAVDDAFLQQVGVHQQVQQRAFDDHVAASLDEAQLRQDAEVHVETGLFTQLVAEVGQQGLVGDADRRVFRARQRLLGAEHVVLVVLRVLVGLLAFALGQDDLCPQHHQQRHAIARQAE